MQVFKWCWQKLGSSNGKASLTSSDTDFDSEILQKVKVKTKMAFAVQNNIVILFEILLITQKFTLGGLLINEKISLVIDISALFFKYTNIFYQL